MRRRPKVRFILPGFTKYNFFSAYARGDERRGCGCRVSVSRVSNDGGGGSGEGRKGIDFSAGLCEMKPGRAIAINNDKNNPIRRLFDLSAPIFRARSIRLITILLDLGGEPRVRAEPRRAESRESASNREIEFAESRPSNYVRDSNFNYWPLSVSASDFLCCRRPDCSFAVPEKILFPLAENLRAIAPISYSV